MSTTTHNAPQTKAKPHLATNHARFAVPGPVNVSQPAPTTVMT
jgi:hypothetical protein